MSTFSNSIVLPDTSFQAATLSSIEDIGVRDSAPSSSSIRLRLKLSTITTSLPCSDKWSAVGQPQNPSPPSISSLLIIILTLHHIVDTIF